MAKRRRTRRRKTKKRGWFKLLILFILTPFLVWILAFVLWFFLPELEKYIDSQGINIPFLQSEDPPEEQIPEEDRRKLDEILKRRR